MHATPSSFYQRGLDALSRGAWLDARQAFETALREQETAAAPEGLGLAAWWLDLAEIVFESRERAYRLFLDANDHASAARVAVWLARDCCWRVCRIVWNARGWNVAKVLWRSWKKVIPTAPMHMRPRVFASRKLRG